LNDRIQRFLGIQYLRALAALMVAYSHLVVQIPAFIPTLGFPLAYRFNRGVDLFFVISGFVMMVTGSTATPRVFLRRRLVRIVPLYWILTFALAAIACIMPALFKTTHVTFAALLQSLLFIPYANQDGQFEPLLVPGWTLNYEMFFYVVFAAALFLRQALIPLVGLTLLAVYLACSLSDPHRALSFYSNPMIFEFLAGLVIGRYYRSIQCPQWTSWLAVAAGVVLLLAPEHREIAMAGAGLIVLGACTLEPNLPKVRAWAFLGDASYSIYLLHIFVFGVTRVIWRGGPFGYVLFSMALVIAIASVSYLYIEKGSLELLARRPVKDQPAPDSPAPGLST
jgi:exopolysaccharide production protein ExoZ